MWNCGASNKCVTQIIYIMAEIFWLDLNKSHSSWRNIIHNFESELGMTASILKDYPDHPFPHVLVYSTLLAIFSIAAVGVISSHVLR